MRAAALLLAFLGLNACSNTLVKASFNSNFTTLPPPVAVSGGQATVRVTSAGGGAAIASMLFLGTLMSLDEPRHGAAFASSGYLYEGFWSRGAPELDADRRISEQDCTRPVDHTLGNIRCK